MTHGFLWVPGLLALALCGYTMRSAVRSAAHGGGLLSTVAVSPLLISVPAVGADPGVYVSAVTVFPKGRNSRRPYPPLRDGRRSGHPSRVQTQKVGPLDQDLFFSKFRNLNFEGPTMKSREKNAYDLKIFRAPLILLLSFWSIAVLLWQTTGNLFYLFNFGYIGTAVGVGIGLYICPVSYTHLRAHET